MGFQMYEPRQALLFWLDPRVKIVGLVAAFTISILFSHPAFLGAMFFGLLLLVLSSRVPFGKIRPLLLAMVALAVISVLMWPLFFKKGTPLFCLWRFTITDDGVLFGIAMAFRILCMVLASVTLMMVTSQRDLILGLRGLGLPYNQSFVLATALRFLPMMVGVGKTIGEAQRARALDLDRGIFKKIGNNAAILAPMIIEAIRLSQQLVFSVEARGFARKDKKTTMAALRLQRRDKAALALLGALLAASVLLRLLGYGYIAR